jgi:hypothetical protein
MVFEQAEIARQRSVSRLDDDWEIKNEFKNETNDGVLHPSRVRGITAVSKETRSGREDVRSNL